MSFPKRAWLIALLVFIVVPLNLYAHVGNPLLYPFGATLMRIAQSSPLLLATLLVTIVVESGFLRLWNPSVSMPGHIWRITVLYLIARVAEEVVLLSVPRLDCAAASRFPLAAAMVFMAGIIPKYFGALLLYSSVEKRIRKMLWMIPVASMCGYITALGIMFLCRYFCY